LSSTSRCLQANPSPLTQAPEQTRSPVLWCGAAKRRPSHGYRHPHQIRAHGRTRPLRTRSEYATDGRPQDYPQPGGLQLPHHRCDGGLRLAPCDAIERDDSVVADRGPGHYPRRVTGNFYSRGCNWSSRSRQAGRVADKAFRRGRSRIDRCVVLRQDRNSDPQRANRHKCSPAAWIRRNTRSRNGGAGEF